MTDERKDQLTAEADGLIEGRNAVIEALRTEASIDKIFIQKGEVDKTLGHIASKARAAGIVVVVLFPAVLHTRCLGLPARRNPDCWLCAPARRR